MFEMKLNGEFSGFDLHSYVDYQWDDYNEAEEGVEETHLLESEDEGWED